MPLKLAVCPLTGCQVPLDDCPAKRASDGKFTVGTQSHAADRLSGIKHSRASAFHIPEDEASAALASVTGQRRFAISTEDRARRPDSSEMGIQDLRVALPG